jgi:hypothetical protein
VSDPIPTTIAALEAGVLARLQAKIENYAIESFPDKPETYKLRHQRGAFLTAYRGADYTPIGDGDATVQARRMMIDVVIQCRQLSGNEGAYVMLELARCALVGFEIPGFTKLSIDRDRFIASNEGVWTYQLTFAAETIAIEVEEELVESTLHRITLQSPFNTSEIPADA